MTADITGDGIIGAWALPRPEDELPHVPSGGRADLPWKDTWYFCFRDQARDLTGAVHLTLSANRDPGFRAAVALRHRGAEVLRTRYDTPVRADDGFGCDLVSLRVLDGTWDERKHLRLTFDTGDVTGTLEVRGRHYGPDLARLCPGLIPTAGSGIEMSGHVEQGAAVAGEFRWGDERLTVEGHGHRDRSWGYRKSDTMNPMGYVFAGVHLPDATMGFLGWQHPDARSGDALPVGGWLADATGVRAAIAGWYRRGPEGRPDACRLEMADGRVVELAGAKPAAEVFFAYHEPEFDGPAIGTLSCDQHVDFDSPAGPVPAVFNHGVPFLADVFRNARFCAPDRTQAPVAR